MQSSSERQRLALAVFGTGAVAPVVPARLLQLKTVAWHCVMPGQPVQAGPSTNVQGGLLSHIPAGRFEGSHSSPVSTMLFPHTIGAAGSWQLLRQPSVSMVLPSSHCSLNGACVSTIVSPQ